MNHQPQTAAQASTSVQGALAAAMKIANDKEIAKNTAPASNVSHIQHNTLKSIVCRKDILGNPLVFDVDSHVKTADGEFIDYWDGKGSSMKTAPLAYYKVSKPMLPADSGKLSESFAKTMKLQAVHVRQRLIKEHTLARDNEGKLNQQDIDAWKLKLIEQVTLAIMAA